MHLARALPILASGNSGAICGTTFNRLEKPSLSEFGDIVEDPKWPEHYPGLSMSKRSPLEPSPLPV
jgi:hypothetical protein